MLLGLLLLQASSVEPAPLSVTKSCFYNWKDWTIIYENVDFHLTEVSIVSIENDLTFTRNNFNPWGCRKVDLKS